MISFFMGGCSKLIHPTTAGITDPEFVDCGETIKHEIKEEGDSEYQIDPLRLFNTPQYSDHSILFYSKGSVHEI